MIIKTLLTPINRKTILRKATRGFLIGLAIFVVLNTLFSLNLFFSWQERLSDSLFISRSPDSNIVIISIDDKSIGEIGRFPWSRSTYANLLNKLSSDTSKPLSIGLDVSFLEKANDEDDKKLSDALLKIKDVTLAAELKPDLNVILPIDS